MKTLHTFCYSLVLLTIASFILPQQVQAQQSTEVLLAGYKMEPRVGTTGSGLATIERSGDTLRVHGEFSDLMSPYSGAYIMGEIMGKSGNVIYRLNAELKEGKKAGVFKKEENTFVLSPAQKKMLREGQLFLTVATNDHSRGEIRAKIPPLGG